MNEIVPPVLVKFNVLLVPNEPALLKVMLLAPLMAAASLSPTAKLLLPRAVVVSAVTVPPFKSNAPVPNGLVALLASSVPPVRVVAPL